MIPLSPAQRVLVEQFYPVALDAARRFSPDEEFEGVAVDALIDVVRNGTVTENIEAFVRRRVKCRCLDALRRQSRLQPYDDSDAPETVPFSESDARLFVQDVLGSVAPLAYATLVGGMSVEELATALGVGLRAAYNRLGNWKEKLRAAA
jgi:DNA-directed RNA polymerase specialized sigma24 family protein